MCDRGTDIRPVSGCSLHHLHATYVVDADDDICYVKELGRNPPMKKRSPQTRLSPVMHFGPAA